jgi:2,3-bisphosphoglycerate-independent phosphoglycerate mutase
MKYIFLVPDGAADDPLPELDGKTPLEAARTPNLDSLAAKGKVGSVLTVPDGMYPAPMSPT